MMAFAAEPHGAGQHDAACGRYGLGKCRRRRGDRRAALHSRRPGPTVPLLYFQPLEASYANRSWRSGRTASSDRRCLDSARHRRFTGQLHDGTNAVGRLRRDYGSGRSGAALDGEAPTGRMNGGSGRFLRSLILTL